MILTACLRRQPVKRVIALAHRADLAAKREIGGSAERAAVLVDVRNANLDRCVVLGGDQAVCAETGIGQSSDEEVWPLGRTGRRALARDVKIDKDTLRVRSFSTSPPSWNQPARTWSFSIVRRLVK